MAKKGKKEIEKEIRMDIQRLKQEGNYPAILEKYGVRKYRKAVSKEYKINHIMQLLENKRYKEIWILYGNEDYDKLIKMGMSQKAQQQKYALISVASPIERIKNFFTKRVMPIILSGAMTVGITGGAIVNWARGSLEGESEEKYAEKIKDYNEKLKQYTEEVKNLNLDDFQTIMKVVDDMWKSIEGYGIPKIDAWGYMRLDMAEDGVGVCRNMADDITAKLNAINPEYNARNLTVYLDGEALQKYGAEMADIERKEVKSEQDTAEEEENRNVNEITKYFGNHMVTAVDIPGKNITLVIDSTNPQIGVFVNGKIHMFFNETGEGIRTTPLGQFVFEGGPETIDVLQTQLLSFLPTEYTLEELEEMYGTDAQNKALEEVRAKAAECDKSTQWRASQAVNIRNQGLPEEGTQTQIGQKLSYETNIDISGQDVGSTTTSTEEEEYEIR